MQNENLKKFIPIAIILILIAVGYFLMRANKETPPEEINQIEEVKSEEQTANEVEVTTTQTDLEKQIGILFDKAAKQQVAKDYVGAKASLEKALSLDPKNAFIMQAYASILNNSGDKVNAMVWIDKALAIAPSEVNLWYLKIDLSKEKYKNDGKIIEPLYLEAIKKTGNDAGMIAGYASFLEIIGKNNEAIKQWEKAIVAYPANKAIYQAEIDRLKAL